MKETKVLVVAGKEEHDRKVSALLKELNYTATLIPSLKDLEQELQKNAKVAVILDLDIVSVTNRFLRDLKKKYPELPLLGISALSYHPGLEEIIGSHLLACLVKPVDVEELCLWLKSISEHLANPGKEAEV
jgi:DNA-binding NtrC family response regulator